MIPSYPTSVWDGDSASRDSDKAPYRSPDANDYNRAVKEVAAVQTRLGTGALGGTVGTASGVSLTRQDLGAFQKLIFTLDEASVAIADGGTKEYGSLKLFDLPADVNKAMASVVDLVCARVGMSLSATADGDYGLGTTVATDADLSGTQVDLHAKTAIAQLADGVGVIVGIADELPAVDDAAACYLNVIFDAGALSDGADAVTVTGTVTLIIAHLGALVNG